MLLVLMIQYYFGICSNCSIYFGTFVLFCYLLWIFAEMASEIEASHTKFVSLFPNATWTVSIAPALRDGRAALEVSITGSKKSNGQVFTLETNQLLALKVENDRVIDYERIKDQSILTTSNRVVPITLNIPDSVLTGTRYDVDIVFDDPLVHYSGNI